MNGLQKQHCKMFVARKSTPPTMNIAICFKGLDMGSAVQDNYTKYPIIHLRCIVTVLRTAIGSHASKCTAK